MHVLGLLGDIGVALKLLLPQIIDSTLFLFVLLLPLSLSTQQFHEICSFRLYNRNLRDLFHLWNHCLNTLFVWIKFWTCPVNVFAWVWVEIINNNHFVRLLLNVLNLSVDWLLLFFVWIVWLLLWKSTRKNTKNLLFAYIKIYGCFLNALLFSLNYLLLLRFWKVKGHHKLRLYRLFL